MPKFATGIVVRILAERPGLTRLTVLVGDEERRATAFTHVTGPMVLGHRVVVNTTAVDLDLGSGGEDFVVWDLEADHAGSLSGGHILKLRYTPWQIDTLAAEAPESRHHAELADAHSLEGLPVVACGVHSQLPAVVAVLKAREPTTRIAYVMTDGAALPMVHSNLVADLRSRGLLDLTITCGHAFGGDLESVNIFSALAAARHAGGADVAVVAMGPGIVGTGTVLGHTGMEQGQVLSAAAALGGRPIAALRISFAEPRERHRVVSHHTLSALRYAALGRSIVAVPQLEPVRLNAVMQRLVEAGIPDRHELALVQAGGVLPALERFGLAPETMGRSVADDPAFHQAAGAAGIVAAGLLAGTPRHP